jgi:hypothetical protein
MVTLDDIGGGGVVKRHHDGFRVIAVPHHAARLSGPPVHTAAPNKLRFDEGSIRGWADCPRRCIALDRVLSESFEAGTTAPAGLLSPFAFHRNCPTLRVRNRPADDR